MSLMKVHHQVYEVHILEVKLIGPDLILNIIS